MTEREFDASPAGATLDAMLQQLGREFPGFRIVDKRDSRLSRWIDRVLRIVTLGGQDKFMSHYHTVIGYTLYVPPTWEMLAEIDKIVLLRHERIHLLQRRRLTFVGMALLYLIPLLPLGLAYGRARLEWEAYTETLRATAELKGIEAARDPALRRAIVSRFVGPDYGWMWPFPKAIERWYDGVLATLTPAARQ